MSDLAGRAALQDSDLVNPWGVIPGGGGTFWVANNATGNSTLYAPDGTINSLVVTIPGGAPTGVVFANPADSAFTIASGDSTLRALFIFVTQEGKVAAWSNALAPPTAAVEVASTADAVYMGAALAGTGDGARLYAANFHAKTIDIFDRHFQPVTIAGAFVDPNLPAGYAPFNIANVDGQLYVAYAQQDAAGEDEVPGAGLGIVDVYDVNGTFVRRLISEGGALNAPWAIVKAPPTFGDFGRRLLVGNFGDGRINAYDSTGVLIGALQDTLGNPLAIEGLWGLSFGRPVSGAEVANRLYFAAGIDDETHGLFGYLAPFGVAPPPPPPPPPPPVACGTGGSVRGIGWWRHLCGGPDVQNLGRGKSEEHAGDHRRGPPPGTPPDTLTNWFGCITASTQAFGGSGCFTAGCDLLARVGRMDRKDRIAQQFLTLLLNRCSGRLCDTVTVACGDGDSIRTVGDIIAFADANLCAGTSLGEVQRLLGCANGSDDDEDDDGDDDGDGANRPGHRVARGALEVAPVGGNPIHLTAGSVARFAISTSVPSVVRLRIYDAAGRLIAEPLHDGTVSGTTEVRWDGLSTRGALVAPGTYFYRATAGEKSAIGRFVIVR